MGCCPKGKTYVSTWIKYLLMAVNFLFVLIGIGMIGCGVWAFQEKNKFVKVEIQDVYDFLFDLSLVMIAIGVVIFLIAFVGFVGALRENVIFLTIYFWALILVFLAQVVLAVLAYVYKEQAITVVSDAIKRGYILTYFDPAQEDNNAIVNFFQEQYHCCGVNDYTDWNANPYYNCTSELETGWTCAVPYSCCQEQDNINNGMLINARCGGGALKDEKKALELIYTEGCIDVLVQLANENLPIIGAVAVAVAIFQLIGIGLGRTFKSQIEDQLTVYQRGR